MPIGGDLGFPYLVLVLLGQVLIGLVVQRKLRISAARREEIKRLLVLASDEAARAELEASVLYTSTPALILQPLQFECAVCFSPTTTRCARCKSVRYCSGKCQIIHWRQGHKDECHQFTFSHKSNDEGGGSYQKALKQKEYDIHENNFETNGKEHSSSSHDKERSEEHLSTNVLSSKLEASCVNVNENGQLCSKSTALVDSIDCLASSGKFNRTKPECTCQHGQRGSTRSSGWTADGSNESSFCEPSTTPSGFRERRINSSMPQVDDALDDSAQAGFSGVDDAGMQSSQSLSSSLIRRSLSPAVERGSGTKIVKLDEHYSSEPISSSSRTYANQTPSAEGPSVSSHALKVSSTCSLNHEKSSHTSTTSRPLESNEDKSVLSNASATHTTSSKVEIAHGISTTEYVRYSPNGRNVAKASMEKVVGQLRASEGSEMTGRHSIKGLFSYDLFVKLYNCNRIELRPFGLTNCGNSCYANALLQCLARTPPLTAYFLQGPHRRACARKDWCFTCEFESLILRAKEGTSPLSPIGILSQIRSVGSHLGNGKEEDAHEFLRYAIDTMQSVCLKEAGVSSPSSLEEETSLIGLTFGGYLRSKIKCSKCGGKSEQHERMMDLTVEIEGDIRTLEEALLKFTATEILDGENKYQCTRCRSYERAKKKLTVQEAPNILTIALKRFQSGKFGKLNKPIKFPEILDMAPYVSGTRDKSPVYRLYGVVVHLDTMNATFSGHYVCYVKNVEKKWFKIDDSKVTAVELESVLTEKAYMLLYARCSPRAPRSIRNLISIDPRKPKNTIFKSGSNPTSPRDASTHARAILEEDSFSEKCSSIFSEECSCSSTDSSYRDSTNSDDYDNFFPDQGRNWKISSDSDSTSSGSDQNSPKHHSTDGIRIWTEKSVIRRKVFGDRLPNRIGNLERKSSIPFLNSDTMKQQ